MRTEKELQEEREKLFELTQYVRPDNVMKLISLLMVISLTLQWVEGTEKSPSQVLREAVVDNEKKETES